MTEWIHILSERYERYDFAALMICFCGDVKVVKLAADKKIPASIEEQDA